MSDFAVSTGAGAPTPDDGGYAQGPDGVYRPSVPVVHRDDEYDPAAFDLLLRMQQRHFWYLGRHRFLLAATRNAITRSRLPQADLRAVDLGGGCGGWISYLHQRAADLFGELALADSSIEALQAALPVVGPAVKRYQVDLLHLGWQRRWDLAFLLDVLEHIPDHLGALREAREALRPGGLLVVSMPALRFFWSYNDELVHHVRRYSRADLANVAAQAHLELCRSRYFMFLLSPLLLASRMGRRNVANMTHEQILAMQRRTHAVPAAPVNRLLQLVFAMETPLGWHCPLPWGSSVMAVFRRPE
jgi:SAM-dependent methyltransferase